MKEAEELDPEISEYLDEIEPEEIKLGEAAKMASFVVPLLRPYRRGLILLGLILFIDTMFNFSFPLVTQYLIDKGLIAHNWDVVVSVLVFLAIAAVAASILGLGSDYLYTRTASDVVRDVRQNLYEQLQRLPLPWFNEARTGDVLSRFSGDLVAVEGVLVNFVPWLVLPLLEVLYSTILMFYFNFWLGLIGALLFPLVLFVPRIFAKKAFGLSYVKRGQEGVLLSAVQENVAAQTIIKAFGLQRRSASGFGALNNGWLKTAFQFNFASALVERSAHTGIYLLHIGVFALGAYWAYTGKITIGTLVGFEEVFLEMGYALTYVTQYAPTAAQAAGSIHRLNDLMGEPPEAADAADAGILPRLAEGVAFENVGFHYPGGKFKLEIPALNMARNSFVAVVGPSGSGKSTVLNLLLRFHEPDRGVIAIDGQDIHKATRESLRAQIGIVFQDNFLFNSSILDNIRVGSPDATLEQVRAAAHDAEIDDFIMALPNQYETSVGERGAQLSGGQRQRLALARALLRDPPILLLDEATSALDHATETAVNATLQRLAKSRLVISVTHRLGSAELADQVVVFEKGKLMETGTHDQLLKSKGFYAAFWEKQSKKKVKKG